MARQMADCRSSYFFCIPSGSCYCSLPLKPWIGRYEIWILVKRYTQGRDISQACHAHRLPPRIQSFLPAKPKPFVSTTVLCREYSPDLLSTAGHMAGTHVGSHFASARHFASDILQSRDVKMCSDERSSRRIEMQSENNHNESERDGNFMQGLHFNEIGDEKEENEESGDLWSLCENNQNEFIKEGNFVQFNEIGDEEEESGDLWSLCKNNQNELVNEGNFMHFNEIGDEEEDNEESGDLWSLCENNQNKLVKEGNFTHFTEIGDEGEENEEPGDLWSFCEPAKSHFESLLGHDGLSPVSNTEPHSARRNFFSNNSLHLCTESLGFESSDERDDCHADFSENLAYFIEEEEEDPDGGCVVAEKRQYAPSPGHMGAKKRATFPPPLSWLKSSLLLRPLRKDGRFLLQEVEEEEAAVPRHEILHTWRENGRLRLHLIPRKNLNFIDTSVDSDTPSDGGQLNGLDAEPRLTSSLPSVDESSAPRALERWGATWENECVEFPRADVSLPLFLVPLDRCQENATCLSTWNPRCITT